MSRLRNELPAGHPAHDHLDAWESAMSRRDTPGPAVATLSYLGAQKALLAAADAVDPLPARPLPDWLAEHADLHKAAQDPNDTKSHIELGKVIRAELGRRLDPILEARKARHDQAEERARTVNAAIYEAKLKAVRAAGDPADFTPAWYAARDAWRSSEEGNRLSNELRKWLEIRWGNAGGSRQIAIDRGAALENLLGEIRPMATQKDMVVKYEDPKAAKLAKVTLEQLRYMPKDWVHGGLARPGDRAASYQARKAVSGPRGRSYHTPGVSHLHSADASVALHELTHEMEERNPGLRRAERNFYQMRTSGEPLTHLGRGYESDEYGRRDQFSDVYMGKDYGEGLWGGRNFELATMGMQSLFYGDYDMDPEMEHWMLGLLGAV